MDAHDTTTADDGAPFGLPVLDEVPQLAAVLDHLVAADRAIAAAVDGLVHLHAAGLAEAATGIGLDGWLAIVARRTGTDRRMLLTTTQVCRRLPHLHRAFSAGAVSWAQLRTLVLQVHQLPRELYAQLDTALADAIEQAADADPDALPRMVRWIVADLAPEHDPGVTGAPTHDRVVLQPRLDGSGGVLFGDLGPVGFAALDAATDPGPTGATRTGGPGSSADPAAVAEVVYGTAQRRAARLTALCLAAGDAHRSGGPTDDDRRDPSPAARVLVRTELSTLLHLDQRPGQLLTHLTGGAMWVDAPTARRLADHATDIRLIVTDGGRPVGVGRIRRTAPGWVRDAILALHDTCSEPGCDAAARVCDLDHARPWSAGGSTDVANLAPVCATGNHTKERAGWQVAQRADGRRTWRHPRTGLVATTLPATWRSRPRDELGGTDPPDRPTPTDRLPF